MVCGICGRMLKGSESIERGFGPVCYRRIMPPAPMRGKAMQKSSTSYNCREDENYNIPGQMELSDFIEIPDQNGGAGND